VLESVLTSFIIQCVDHFQVSAALGLSALHSTAVCMLFHFKHCSITPYLRVGWPQGVSGYNTKNAVIFLPQVRWLQKSNQHELRPSYTLCWSFKSVALVSREEKWAQISEQKWNKKKKERTDHPHFHSNSREIACHSPQCRHNNVALHGFSVMLHVLEDIIKCSELVQQNNYRSTSQSINLFSQLCNNIKMSTNKTM